ncbi:MAG TPA: hypothetical protein VFA34_11850 [Actinomycetota bacterium]|jgi:hypothetical protein|nr:hypothetical protein [Actinomycetota bacterium]
MLRRLWLALSIVAVAGLIVVAGASGGRATSVEFSWAMVGPGAPAPPASDIVLSNCGGVPSGMWVRGTGVWTLFSPTGSGAIQSMAHGTAVDSAGDTYRWNYHQSIQPMNDGVHSRVVDDFVLSGRGSASGIHSHFIAIIEGTSLEESPTFELLHLLGDPFNCDPL